MATLILDVRLLFADQLAEILKASAELFHQYPNDPRLNGLRAAWRNFAEREPFDLPPVRLSNN